MAKWTTIIEERKCPLCGRPTDNEIVHMASVHPAVRRIGDIYWLNRREAFYRGKRYERTKGGLTWQER